MDRATGGHGSRTNPPGDRLLMKERLRSLLWIARFEAVCLYRRKTENVCIWIARRIPRAVRKWVVVNAYCDAWSKVGDKTPDELTYTEVYDAAVKGRM